MSADATQHNSQAALVGLMETRGLSERIAGMERFIMAEMERIKDSLDSRLTQLELTASATTNETRLILRQLASTIQDSQTQQNVEKTVQAQQQQQQTQWTEQHVALMIQAKVQEAVLGIDREITGVQEGVVMKLEREKEALSGLVEALEKRVAGMEAEAKERQGQSEQNLRMLLDGVMGVKQAMMQLGKGTADKKIHDEYLQELKAVKDDLLADLRDAKDEFQRKLVSIARVSTLDL
ncbi:hypothetical protein HDU79_009357 [Rhizoclosmatium sp. JEL0117]|nr:hypothetical protein HDU79_009357 [Rhizoclosmatium sp. JEL0117]